MEFLILWEDRLLPWYRIFILLDSSLHLWHINIQCILLSQVRYISQDIQEIKYCNILLCWRQLVSRGRCGDLGGLCKKSLLAMDFVNLCDTENSVVSEG